MGETKITDLVPQETIDKIKELNTETQSLLETYTNTARELAKGLDVNVRLVGDVDKLENLLAAKIKETVTTTERLNSVMNEYSTVTNNTTNTIARHLMEQERVNKAQRESYTEHDRVKKLLDQFHDTYENQLQSLVKITRELENNKKAQKDNEKALTLGKVSLAQFTARQAELIASHRSLIQEKRTLTQIMTAEEKAAQSPETSYVHMSQQLELLRKAYKELSEEGVKSDFGRELETTIQNLNAHLTDFAAGVGEFQRNVGNYAIAGKQGVVTTESVVEAMNRQARTTQDLVDQTKILEEAKLMLDKEDVNYQTTLDSLNAKLEENKRKLTDVSDILHKDAASVSEAEAQNKRLQEALKRVDLTSDDAQKRIKELNDKIAANTKLIRENTPALQDQTKANEGLADSLLGLIGLNTRFGASLRGMENARTANFLDGLTVKVKAFGKTLIGMLANPWVLAFLGIAGVVAGFKWWYDYNKGLIEASRLTQNFTGLTGEAADKITTDTQAIADHMDKNFDDTIGAANTLVQQFGLSWEEALEKIEDGIEAGADMNGRLIENINQFAPALRDAGVSVDEFVSILAETRNGIFSEHGVQDILKGGTRLRAMTKQISESLDAVGISSRQMQEDLAKGNITMLDAVQQVASKLRELPENSQEAGQIMKNVFGRTAAEGGTLLIQSIADVNTNLDIAKDRMGELGRLNREHIEAQKELNETLAAVFKMSGTSFEEMTVQAKTYIAQGLTGIITGCVDIYNWFVRMYNSTQQVRGSLNGIAVVFKLIWSVAKAVVKNLVESFKGVGNMLEGIATLSWEKFRDGYTNAAKACLDNFKTAGQEIGDAFVDGYNNTVNGKLNEVSLDLAGDTTPGAGQHSKRTSDYTPAKSDEDEKSREKAAREAEKAAKEELKRLHDLEESKIAIMEEGHEKELAEIRLKFKKKIDAVRGDGETEKALRIQLAEQCQKEVSACEARYQKELAQINLENRLAYVEKGSKEELNLKLAQLEASRVAELKAADKTGADKNLIDEKFNHHRQELMEEFASAQSDAIMKEFASEKEIMEANHILQIAALQKQYNTALAAADGHHGKMEKAEKEFQDKMKKLEQNYAIEQAQSAVNMYERMLTTAGLSAELRLDIERQLARARAELQKVTAEGEKPDAGTDGAGFIDGDFLTGFQKWGEVALGVIDTVNSHMQAFYDGQIARIEELQEANTAAGDAEMERTTELVEKKVISQEEGEARKRAAEAATAKKNEELEKKKQQLRIRQAYWDKANSAVQVTYSTALAVMNALEMKPFMPLGLAMAAIAGAMGATQLATIAATPIPRYAKGTDYHKGGPAIVGDGGVPELILFRGKSWITPDTPTLVDMPAGATVIPEIIDIRNNTAGGGGPSLSPMAYPAVRPFSDVALRRAISEIAGLLRYQTRQQHNDAYLANYEMFKRNIC